MAYRFEGYGNVKEFVEECDKLLERTDSCKVVQAQSMSGIASMNIGGGRWEVIMGD